MFTSVSPRNTRYIVGIAVPNHTNSTPRKKPSKHGTPERKDTTMPTSEERRLVAKELRYTASHSLDGYSFQRSVEWTVFGTIGDRPWRVTLTRLADLIEPEPEITCELDSQVCGKRRCKRCGAFVSVDSVWDCSGCIPAKYCPNCGAKVVE